MNADPAQITDPKIQDLIASFNQLLKNDGIAFYPDWPAPGYYDILVNNVQELMGGQKNPTQFLDAIATAYAQR